MDLKNTIFAILAIFCVVFSACAVCAADDVSNNSGDFTIDEAEAIHDGMVLPPDYAHNETQNTTEDLDAEAIHDNMTLPPDYAHNEQAMMNTTNGTHAAGENITANATTAHALHATGNPILALLAVGAVLGGASLLIRRK